VVLVELVLLQQLQEQILLLHIMEELLHPEVVDMEETLQVLLQILVQREHRVDQAVVVD